MMVYYFNYLIQEEKARDLLKKRKKYMLISIDAEKSFNVNQDKFVI